ncbi:cytochrome c oxidase subunit II [Bacillaceae bacterium SIJ1]|uniref:cytochrome c oxidase subunit II n=1 Tax=Litoribacterium kuwaitense TaxID=1398745 RepID=UPI0013EE3CCF|nr:cytochrome c oxidase subunit II [Litoribacterium kuwaitense]NGP44378.1 cytochrome c oxidase subunit II [Litoribacterium kuwaitense]
MKSVRNKWQLPLKYSVLSLLALVLAGCGTENLSSLQPKGEGANMLFDLMVLSIVIMIAVFLVVIAIYTYVIVRFRKKKGDKDIIPEQVEGNRNLEIIWTVIPILLLLVLAVPTVAYTFQLADTSERDAEGSENHVVNVTAHTFWWNFEYEGEEVTTSQDLYIPTGEKVFVNLSSADVIHSFWVPAIQGKMDTNPGDENINTIFLEADEEGVYWGKCAEFCGPSHALMDFRVIAVSPEEFDAWLDDMRQGPGETDSEVAAAGEEIFAQSCASCHAVEAGAPGGVGPNLTSFGDRTKIAGFLDHDKETLKQWIRDPQEFKPGNNMPAFPAEQISDEDLDALAEYLLELKVQDE